MNLTELIKQLEELEAKATPGEWLRGAVESYHMDGMPFRCVYSPRQRTAEYPSDRMYINGEDCDDNAELIAKSRNTLPTLLTALKEAMEVVEFYGDHSRETNLYGANPHQMNSDRENYRILEDEGAKARAFREKWGMK